MLKESKPQSKSPTPSFYHYFETPFVKHYPQYSRYRSRSNSNRYNDKSYAHNHPSYYDLNRSRFGKPYNQYPYKSYYSPSRPYYNSTFSRSPAKYYPRSGERSSSYNNASFKRYNSPYRPPSKPRNDRYRSRSPTNSKQYSNFQYKSSVNLTYPSTPILHNTPSTEPKFEINLYKKITLTGATISSNLSSFHKILLY